MKEKDAIKVLLKENFNISFKDNKTHYMEKPHFHDSYEIHYTSKGNTQYVINENVYEGSSGMVAVMNAMELHKITLDSREGYERYIINFKPKFLASLVNDISDLNLLFTERFSGFENCIQLSENEKCYFENMLKELIELNDSAKTYFRELKLQLKLMEIIIYLNERYLIELNNGSTVRVENRLENIIKYINKNFYKNINIDILANDFYMSKSSLIRLFKENIGLPPGQFIKYVKVIKGRDLLMLGLTIKEVSSKVGYKDESSFIKNFKEIIGETPKQYILKLERKR